MLPPSGSGSSPHLCGTPSAPIDHPPERYERTERGMNDEPANNPLNIGIATKGPWMMRRRWSRSGGGWIKAHNQWDMGNKNDNHLQPPWPRVIEPWSSNKAALYLIRGPLPFSVNCPHRFNGLIGWSCWLGSCCWCRFVSLLTRIHLCWREHQHQQLP